MSKSRVKTSENFKKILPFSGDAVACAMIPDDGGAWVHMTIKLARGHQIILSVPESTIGSFPEYFEDEILKL